MNLMAPLGQIVYQRIGRGVFARRMFTKGSCDTMETDGSVFALAGGEEDAGMPPCFTV